MDRRAGGCSSYDSRWNSCTIDRGFTFRRVTNFDEEECTYDLPDTVTCNVVKARCCFWWPVTGVCITCPSCCEPHDLCKSFWLVREFHEDGDSGRGCWALEFISDCTEEDCEDGLEMCDEVVAWDD